MKIENKGKEDYLKEYTKLVEDYIDFENRCHEYFSQFFSIWMGGKLVKMATRGDTQVEFEKRQEMRKELENKRKKVMEAQKKYLAFCKGN
ncbi:MAG: hypothetical protein NT155_04895 [Candidatus Staskawiczbacteria bacterium]|nr:hypothetical protein [Candidatus Staskawiczbacteria bacterium]